MPDFDASDLHPKYENFPWTGEFPSEKLCISEIGLKDVWRDGKFLRTGYRDIACVPLPGATLENMSPEHLDEEYLPAAKARRKNLPLTPLVIPSTPLS